ncbi:response regulator [Sulfurimonas sp. SAG-AH-194-C21]|nr:ATP-binding protein [Sulfurimonas sp. SAG-AH-194-C21]MDF1882343.1 response regulator [Sulfurimonas sp. SAG-AH-194-C21]
MKQLTLGHKISLGFGLITILTTIFIMINSIKITEVNTIRESIRHLRLPTVEQNTRLLNGVNHSLGSLRAWIILGEEESKFERVFAWQEDIEPALEILTELSQRWTNPQNIEKFHRLTPLFKEFKKYQQDIEDIAHTPENEPALKILFDEAIPQTRILTNSMEKIIDLELQEPASYERKVLLGFMADLHGTTAMSLADIRAYLLSGDKKFQTSFYKSWKRNTKNFLSLENRVGFLNKKQKKYFDKYRLAREKFTPLPKKMFDIRGSQMWNVSNYLLKTKAAPTAEKIRKTLHEMLQNQRQLMHSEVQKSVEATGSLQLFGLIALLSVIIISIIASILLRKTINKQFSQLQKGLLGFFDYLNKKSEKVPYLDDSSGDELAAMSKIINDNISQTVKILEENKDIFRQLQEYKRAIDEHSIVTVTDTNGIIIYVNDKFVEISGYSKEETLGKTHSVVNSGMYDSDFWATMHKTIAKKKIWKYEVCNRAKDGSLYWVDSSIVPILDKNEEIKNYIAIRHDITQRKENEIELIKAKEMAVVSSTAKSEFLMNMSHEIRTPLNAIMGFIGILTEQEADEEKLKYLKTINSSSQSLTNIINDILDFSKIENGQLDIESINFDPSYEFKSTQDLFFAKSEEKSIQLEISFSNLPHYLKGDILRIKQVVNNLLSNAIKFTPKNKHIFLNIEYRDEMLHVSVKDEGIGITPEYKKKIFDSFSQADSTTTRKYGGTGLGLSISTKLVELMGGELQVTSELGVGSEFYFSLPLESVKDSTKSVSERPLQDFTGLKLLLVEDDKTNQMFMEVILKKLKVTYEIVGNGLDAIDAFKQNDYNLILMDENMPNMNGIEATKKIIELEKELGLEHTPIVALTANALKGDRERFLEAGMDEYLTKPLNKKNLIRIFEMYFHNKTQI